MLFRYAVGVPMRDEGYCAIPADGSNVDGALRHHHHLRRPPVRCHAMGGLRSSPARSLADRLLLPLI